MLLPFLLGVAQSLAPVGERAAAPKQPDRVESANIVAAEPAATSGKSGGFVILGANRTVGGGHEIYRSRDGLFYLTAVVNGVTVRFVVDTGATVVVLTPDDARRAGLSVNADDFRSQASTANGRAAMARVKIGEVVVGTRRDQAIDAAVVEGGLTVSLLGQSWLSRLQSVTITGDRMLLN